MLLNGQNLYYLIVLFLIGSIPTGYLLTKYSGLGDIRKVGSGNIGATNVLRHSGKKLGLLTLLLDFIKGFLPFFLLFKLTEPAARDFTSNSEIQSYLFYSAPILGHIFSPWLKFKGGKGVATTFGVFFFLFIVLLGKDVHGSNTYYFLIFFLMMLVWLATVFFTRYVALGSVYSLCVPTIISLFYWPNFFIFFLFLTLLIAYKHKDNFERIRNNKEHKISF
jgi:glycerol-3-phosphate acyltransferase PlsY